MYNSYYITYHILHVVKRDTFTVPISRIYKIRTYVLMIKSHMHYHYANIPFTAKREALLIIIRPRNEANIYHGSGANEKLYR